MKNKITFKESEIDKELYSISKIIPDSGCIDAEQFLSKNKEAIISGINKSRSHYRKTVFAKVSVAASILICLTLLFSFSSEARAYVKNIYYTVVEWFDSGNDKSGVIFNIDNNNAQSAAPQKIGTETGKTEFSAVSAAKEIYGRKIYELTGPDITFVGGYIENNTICLNYKSGDNKIQLIEEPMQQEGSVGFHFNDPAFKKYSSDSGTLYYQLNDSKLFGGMVINDTILVISGDGITDSNLDSVIDSID